MRKMDKLEPIKVMRIIARMNVGGPAIQITNMLNGLSPSEIEQRLYFGSCEIGEAEYIDEILNKDALHRIPGFRRSIGAFSEVGVLFHLIREMRRFKPDVIHTHTAKAGLLGRLAAIISRSKAKRVHTFHGHVLYGYFNPFINSLYATVERVLAHYTDVIISVGPEVRDDLIKYRIGKPTKHRVIFPGIKVSERLPKSQALKELNLPNKKLTLAFIGRFTAIKRIDRIVELARMCKHEGLDVQFVLAGEGPELEKVRETAELENLPMSFLGWRSDVERILSASDALILTSDNEGTPISSIQASLIGVPTISTKVGSMQDVVIHGKTGLLTSANSKDIFRAIYRLHSDKDVVVKYGNAARKFAEQKFSKEIFLKEHRALYKNICD